MIHNEPITLHSPPVLDSQSARSSSDAKQPSQLPVQFTDKSKTIQIDSTAVGKSAKIAVDDAKTGNTAIIPPAGKPSADGTSIDLSKLDFDHVRQVRIAVNYEGK